MTWSRLSAAAARRSGRISRPADSGSTACCRTRPLPVRGDADALSQIIVNLLSNAEKYSSSPASASSPRPSGERAGARGTESDLLTDNKREITLELTRRESPLPYAEVKVLDRGLGVPRGSGEKIFEKFLPGARFPEQRGPGFGPGTDHRPADRAGARGRCGVRAARRRGSCFILRLPIKPVETTNEHE